MTRSPRPSQVHRLPAPNGGPPPPQPAQRGGRRGPLLVVGAAATALLLLAVLTDTDPRSPQLVPLDVVSEDEAVAALGLFAAQEAAAAAISPQILAQPGPHDMARQARADAEAAAEALRHARSQPGPGGLDATAYWSSPGHDWFVGELRNLADLADDIALLAAVHDTLYGGAGLIAAAEAEQALVNRFRAGRPPAAALSEWSDMLLAELDGHDATAPATQARLATEQHWAQAAARVRPPDVERLHDYVASLPSGLVEGLRGHPVAGPALDRLGR